MVSLAQDDLVGRRARPPLEDAHGDVAVDGLEIEGRDRQAVDVDVSVVADADALHLRARGEAVDDPADRRGPELGVDHAVPSLAVPARRVDERIQAVGERDGREHRGDRRGHREEGAARRDRFVATAERPRSARLAQPLGRGRWPRPRRPAGMPSAGSLAGATRGGLQAARWRSSGSRSARLRRRGRVRRRGTQGRARPPAPRRPGTSPESATATTTAPTAPQTPTTAARATAKPTRSLGRDPMARRARTSPGASRLDLDTA